MRQASHFATIGVTASRRVHVARIEPGFAQQGGALLASFCTARSSTSQKHPLPAAQLELARSRRGPALPAPFDQHELREHGKSANNRQCSHGCALRIANVAPTSLPYMRAPLFDDRRT